MGTFGTLRLGLGLNGGGGGGAPAFDGIGTPYALFGGARLLTSYTGAIGRWRRASDNDQQDIFIVGKTPQLSGGGSVASWLGTNDAFWVTFYDQSGNARNATQATASAQARAALAGVIDLGPSGRPAAVFNGSGTFYLVGASTGFSRNQAALTIGVSASTTNSASSPYVVGSNGTNTNQRAGIAFTSGNARLVARRATADAATLVDRALPAGSRRLIGRFRYSDGAADMAVDGAVSTGAMSGAAGPSEDFNSVTAFTIGRPAGLNIGYYAGAVSAVALFQASEDIEALDAALARSA